jgi:hypothetical protein
LEVWLKKWHESPGKGSGIMSDFDSKILWTVKMPTKDAETLLLAHARAAGCDGVAIRTSNDRLEGAIARFHDEGIKVYGWRWPARSAINPPPSNYYAIDQAHFVVDTLIKAGLDGFYADIESDGDNKANDWNSADYAPVAHEFCSIIKAGAPAGFAFGLTAGCGQPKGSPHIPWAQFSPFIDFIMPQTYWRWLSPKTGKPEDINGKSPAAAIAKAKAAWGSAFPSMAMVPIMGELIYVAATEIADYGKLIVADGVREFHAYTDGNEVSPANLAAIAAL